MSSISSVEFLDPFSQLEHLGSAISEFASSLLERTDETFQRVVVSKRDAHGNIKSYQVKDRKTGESKTVTEISFIENVRTGDLQLDEPLDIIQSKCATYAFGLPFYTVGKMAWYAVKTPIEIAALAFQTLVDLGRQFLRGEYSLGMLKERAVQIAGTLGNGLFEIVKAPFFGLAAELAALYGIIRPLQGRSIVAKIEFGWQLGISYKNDMRDRLCFDQPDCWKAFLENIQGDRTFYLARCFQVRGNVSDPRVIVIRREAL